MFKMSGYEAKKDCFGYCKEKNTCSVLRRLFCKTEQCGFYKTRKQFDADKEKWGYNPKCI